MSKKITHYYHTFGRQAPKQSNYGHNFDYPTIYRNMVEQAPNNAHFVEIGSHIGGSSCFMAVEIANSNKNIKFDCIDPWEDDPVYGMDRYEEFIRHMKPVESYYKAIRAYSPDIASEYKDESLDFVWIDGDHWYPGVQADILGWLPKLKRGGWMAGHDCDHCGGDVLKAVTDTLPYYYFNELIGFFQGESSFQDTEDNLIIHEYLKGVQLRTSFIFKKI